MRITISLLFLPLLLFCDRSVAGSYDHASVGAESEPRDGVTDDINLRREKPNQASHFERSAGQWASNSSRAELLCPDAAAIAPCVCTVDINDNIDLNCTSVESEEQLARVFQEEFPVKELHEFYMKNNEAITVLGNILNGLTFESINFYPGPFALEQISESFFLDNSETLTSVAIINSELTSDGFPFLVLSTMKNLAYIFIHFSEITWIPLIEAPRIYFIHIVHGPTDIIEAGTFPIHEWDTLLEVSSNEISSVEPDSFFFADENSATSNGSLTIDVGNNRLESLQAGTFPLRNGEVDLQFWGNKIVSIEQGTFVLPEATGATSYGPLSIDLRNNRLHSLQAGTIPLRNGEVDIIIHTNYIAYIEPGTFVLPEATDSLELALLLYYNNLTIIDEAVFGDLMPFVTELSVYDNPLACACDIAWLVLNSEYLDKVDSFANCDNGTNLHELDPQFYMDAC